MRKHVWRRRTTSHNDEMQSTAESVVNGLSSSLSASLQACVRKNRIVHADVEKFSLQDRLGPTVASLSSVEQNVDYRSPTTARSMFSLVRCRKTVLLRRVSFRMDSRLTSSIGDVVCHIIRSSLRFSQADSAMKTQISSSLASDCISVLREG